MDDSPDQPGPEPNDGSNDDALGGEREQDDQQAVDDGVDPELRRARAEAKRYRLAAREAQAEAKSLRDQGKSEMQRIQDENVANAQRADLAERRALRLEVAAEFGIPSQHVKRLAGDTRAELVADAKALATEFGIDAGNGGEQRPNFSSGVRRPVQRPKTMNDVIRQASGR